MTGGLSFTPASDYRSIPSQMIRDQILTSDLNQDWSLPKSSLKPLHPGVTGQDDSWHKEEKAREMYRAYRIRMQAPRSDAEFEGLTLNSFSERYFRPFVTSAIAPKGFSSTGTVHLNTFIDLLIRWEADLHKAKKAQKKYDAYETRIKTLKSYAEHEGFAVKISSERDFWSFFKSVPFALKADLVLLGNGNLRAIWEEEDDSHLGIQFLGDRMLQYVIFRQREASSEVSRVAGRDTFEGVKEQVRIFGLEAFLGA